MPINCGDTGIMLDSLEQKFNESITFIGSKDNTDNVFTTLWVSPANGTWTVITTIRSEGISCVLQAGTGGYQLFKDDISM